MHVPHVLDEPALYPKGTLQRTSLVDLDRLCCGSLPTARVDRSGGVKEWTDE